ncbi:MAG TPA: cupin domain-containing protein [Patescibacteria group bacterium]
MKYKIKKSEAITTQENGISRFHEYQFPFQNASLGVSEINGRYPESGFDIDTEVEASWYVEEGNANIWIGGKIYQVEKGDMVYVPKNEKYWIDGKNLKLVVASSPVWHPDQHSHIEE